MNFHFFLNLYSKNSAIPNYFVWLRYFSWFSYANENLLLNQWEGVGNMTNLDVTCEFTSSCFFTGDQLIDRNKWNRVSFKILLS